jgi:hypothetical protein
MVMDVFLQITVFFVIHPSSVNIVDKPLQKRKKSRPIVPNRAKTIHFGSHADQTKSNQIKP